MKNISLNGQWDYIADPKENGESRKYFDPSFKFKPSKKMLVPSNWETAGLEDYSGTVWFKTFLPKIELSENEDAILQFGAVDYFTKVWLNGSLLGDHEGYFQPFEFDITKYVRGHGPGALVVKVSAPAEPVGKDGWPHKKRMIKGVLGHHDVRPGAWSPELGQSHGTGGIWSDVSLIICNKLRFAGVKVSPKLTEDRKTAELSIELFIENTKPHGEKGLLKIEISHWLKDTGKNTGKRPFPVIELEIPVDIPPGISVYFAKPVLKDPFLWWPWDHGEQNLYVIGAKLSIQKEDETVSEISEKFGIREIKIVENKAWQINGRKIFIRGSNIIPEEYLSAYNSERIKKDVQLIKEANCNAIRVHAHVNRKELYDAFDKAGIMVWQDFPLQWEYSGSEEFVAEASRQIKDMVNLLHNNPCVVVWCCHNEPVSSGKMIDQTLHRSVLEEDSTRAIIRSSDFGEHPYPGWFWGDYKYFFSLVGKPFPSEFGAQALPCEATLKKMFNRKDLWPPNWKEWAYRDFVYEQTFHIAGVEKGKTLKQFVENSQNYQSGLIKYAVERYRQHKWSEITGFFHFMLLEPWPAISYSVTDYFRNPKKAYFTLKRCFQPVLMISSLQRKTYGLGAKIEGQFWIVNDHFRDFENARIVISIRADGKLKHQYPHIMLNIIKDTCNEITNIVYSYTKGLEIPPRLKAGPAQIYNEVFDNNGALLSQNIEEINLEKIPAGIKEFNADFVWE